VRNDVLTVRDSEHSVADSVWEALAEFGKHGKKSWVAQIRLAGPTFPGVEIILNSIILVYNCYICILLIKANSMIYICYIFGKGGVEICVLAVRDSEHDRGGQCRRLPRGRDTCGKREEVTR
jgi:hypothetical protein